MLRSLLRDKLLYCPSCRGIYEGAYRESPVYLDQSLCELDDRVIHGFLVCGSCPARYPIIDGIPILMREPGAYLARMEDAAIWREDLPAPLRQWFLSHYEEHKEPGWRRQMIAVYGTMLRPPADSDDPFQQHLNEQIRRSREFLEDRQAEAMREWASAATSPLALDAGCGVGAASLTLARQGARVVALDFDFAPLKVLSRLVRFGRADIPTWRHGGGDYQWSEIELSQDGADRILPLAADALNPPFRSHTFDLATCYNLLDNVAQPVVLVRQLHAILKSSARLLLTSPYDWAARCTAPEHQLGGGIRPDNQADPAAVLRLLLEGGLPDIAPEVKFRILHEQPALPWVIHRHARSYHVFLCHFVDAVVGAAGQGTRA